MNSEWGHFAGLSGSIDKIPGVLFLEIATLDEWKTYVFGEHTLGHVGLTHSKRFSASRLTRPTHNNCISISTLKIQKAFRVLPAMLIAKANGILVMLSPIAISCLPAQSKIWYPKCIINN